MLKVINFLKYYSKSFSCHIMRQCKLKNKGYFLFTNKNVYFIESSLLLFNLHCYVVEILKTNN